MTKKFSRLRALAMVSALGAPAAAYATSPLGDSTDPLLGGTGAAYANAPGASVNPANAGFVDHSQFFYEPELFQSTTLDVRYPGFEPTEQDSAGAGSFLTPPAFIYKLTPKLGIAGFVVPGGISLQIHQTHIPIVILKTNNSNGVEDYVDLNATGTLGGLANFLVGYRFNDRIGIGLSFTYLSFSAKGTLTPSSGGSELGDFDISSQDTSVVLGVRVEPVPGRLAIGIASTVVDISTTNTAFNSPLASGIGGGSSGSGGSSGGSALGGGAGGGSITTPLKEVVAGVMIGLGPKVRLLADTHYDRADKTATGFSIVELKEKPIDYHDTLDARVGAMFNVMEGGNALLGFRYEPSAIGPGSRGDNGTIGFGTMDLVEIFAGMGDLTPYTEYAGGIQLGYLPKWEHEKKGKRSEEHGYYALTVATGIVYRVASLGIDQNGELPGAYLYKKTSVPVALTYKF